MSLPRALIERFARHLGEVHAEVRPLEVGLDAPGSDPPAILESLRIIAHKLAGTAEAYGFSGVGESAQSLERAIQRDDGDGSAVRGGVRRLREALESAVEDPPT